MFYPRLLTRDSWMADVPQHGRVMVPRQAEAAKPISSEASRLRGGPDGGNGVKVLGEYLPQKWDDQAGRDN